MGNRTSGKQPSEIIFIVGRLLRMFYGDEKKQTESKQME